MMLAALLALGSAAATADLRLSFESTPGDFIGAGQSFDGTYAEGDANLNVDGGPDGILLSYFGSPGWQLLVRSTGLHPFAPACYERATSSADIGRPGLEFSFDARSCGGTNMARFKVLDFDFDERAGSLSSLAVDFVQHCGDGAPLFGKVRYNTSIPLDTPPLEPVLDTIGEFHYVSGPGDFVGDGTARSFMLDSSTLHAGNSDGGFQVSYFGPEGGFWSLDLAGADDEPLVAGTYIHAERYPFQTDGHPGLSYVMDGRACNALDGRFTIASMATEPIDGRPVEFKASFEQRCREGSGSLDGYLGFQTTYRNGPFVGDEVFLDSFDGVKLWPLVWPCPLDTASAR